MDTLVKSSQHVVSDLCFVYLQRGQPLVWCDILYSLVDILIGGQSAGCTLVSAS